MKSFAYLRVSSRDQVKGTSLDKQREICTIIGRNLGIFDLDFYEEPGISGESIRGRPIFQSLLDRVTQGDYDSGIGISFDQDRLSRRTMDWTQISDLFREHGIRLHTSQGIMDFSKKDQELMSNIKGSLSQWELQTIRERTQDGKRRRMLQGDWSGGSILWGYRYNPNLPKGKRLEVDPRIAATVRLLLLDLKNIPLYEIAKEMNRRNIASPKGGLWNSNKVYAFFDENRLLRYSGYARVFYQRNGDGNWKHIPEGILVKANWPAIINPRERGRILKRKEKWKKIRVYPTKANKLITGLGIAYCGHCGTSVGTNSSHRNKDGSLRAYYGCMDRSCAERPLFRTQIIDHIIIKAIKSIDVKNVLEAYNYLLNLENKRASSPIMENLEIRMNQIIDRRNRIVEKIASGLVEDQEAELIMGNLRHTLESLRGEKSRLTSKGMTKFLSMSEFKKLKRAFSKFENLSMEDQRLGLKGLVGRINFWQDRIEIKFSFPINKRAKITITCPVSSTG